MTAEKKCKVEVVRHPVDGIRFETRGDKGVCDEHMHELLKDAGPFLKQFVHRRRDHIDQE